MEKLHGGIFLRSYFLDYQLGHAAHPVAVHGALFVRCPDRSHHLIHLVMNLCHSGLDSANQN